MFGQIKKRKIFEGNQRARLSKYNLSLETPSPIQTSATIDINNYLSTKAYLKSVVLQKVGLLTIRKDLYYYLKEILE